MERKRLVSIALMIIMLLNCVLPVFAVDNAQQSNGIQLNLKLYTAIKADLTSQGVEFSSNDVNHTLYISEDVKSTITKLTLNNAGLSNLDGLQNFTALTSLELSGNILDKDSLAPLSALTNLTHLDLSTNKIEDVTSIKSLVDKLKNIDGGIILSGQTVDIVQSIMVDTEEDSDNATTAKFDIPLILEYAGYIKAVWKDVSYPVKGEDETGPRLNSDSVPMYISSSNKQGTVTIYNDVTGTGYYGLVKLKIEIKDNDYEASLASNKNPAASNLLNGSVFNLYIVVYPKSAEAITIKDSALYDAIKEQLTGGQTINPELDSYPYVVDSNGEIVYETYIYKDGATGFYNLYRFNENDPTNMNDLQYVLNKTTGELYKSTDGTTQTLVSNAKYEKTVARYTNEKTGEIMEYAAYKVASTGNGAGTKANKTLYISAYDVAKTFVIDDMVLTNDIKSLILNNRRIKDLEGIQYFIGLSSKLDVSHNYIDNIEPLIKLQEQKSEWEKLIVEKYNYWLKNREQGNLTSSMSTIKTKYEEIKSANESIAKAKETYDKAKETTKNDENYDKNIQSAADTYKKAVYGYEENDKHVDGYADKIKTAIKEINIEIANSYRWLHNLYEYFEDEYKLTTLLSDDINYMTYEEYKTYLTGTDDKKGATKETAKSLFSSQISRINELEKSNALSDLDKQLLEKAEEDMYIAYEQKTDTKTPISDYYNEYFNKTVLGRAKYVEKINIFREINLYSEMANYCLLKRIDKGVPSTDYCYEEEYLEKRIQELDDEYLPSDLEKAILESIKNGTTYNSKYYDIYKNYESTLADNFDDIYMGKGKYLDVYNYDSDGNATSVRPDGLLLNSNVENYIKQQQVISGVSLFETVSVDGNKETSENGELDLYNQFVTISNRLVIGNVERYVKLPNLKNLDISYNADLNNIDSLSKLEQLRTLNASYCYIADVENVDWANMKYLRKLSLGYNFISDITSILNVPDLAYLDLNNNLISGDLVISEEKFQELFEHLKTLNLSGNQITDINSLLIFADYKSEGNYMYYFVQKTNSNNKMDVDLSNQNIELEVSEPISLSKYPTTVNIELPKIFTQFLALDMQRVNLGETSQKGRINSEGVYVTLNTRTVGDKEGKVVVLPMDGFDTCLGNGTIATIKYKVESGNTTPDPDTNTNTTPNPDTNTNTTPNPDTNTNTTPSPDTNTNTTPSPDTNTNTNTSTDPEREVINTKDLGYDVSEDYMLGIKTKTPVEDFKTVLLNGKKYNVVVTKDGKEVTSGNMMTGMFVKVQDSNGNELKDQNGDLVVYEIVVKGDVNGDGIANSLDSNMIKAYRADLVKLEGSQKEAADINSDGKIDAKDSKLLLYHRAEVKGYNLNYSK